MLNTIALLFFPLMMAFAAISDLTTMKISNRLVLMLALGFIVVALLINLPMRDAAWHLGIGIIVLVAAFTFFAMGWIGGGDAKFAAASALWLGVPSVVPYLIYAGLLGGALTLALLAVRRMPLPQPLATVGWIGRLHDQSTGIPYGIALAVAGLIVYSNTSIFNALLG